MLKFKQSKDGTWQVVDKLETVPKKKETPKKKTTPKPVKPDFSKMTDEQLVEHAKLNKIDISTVNTHDEVITLLSK